MDQKKKKKGSSVRDFVAAQMSPATDGSAVHTGLMDRWFVSSRKVNRSVLPRRRAEAGRLESHVSRFYLTNVYQPHNERTEKAVLLSVGAAGATWLRRRGPQPPDSDHYHNFIFHPGLKSRSQATESSPTVSNQKPSSFQNDSIATVNDSFKSFTQTDGNEERKKENCFLPSGATSFSTVNSNRRQKYNHLRHSHQFLGGITGGRKALVDVSQQETHRCVFE